MSRLTAESALDALRNRPSYVAHEYVAAPDGTEIQVSVFSHLRRLATVDMVAEVASAKARKTEILADYGLPSSSPTEKPFAYSDGVAIIPIHGILINRFPYCWGFVTGYNYIRNMLQAALEDDDVTLIAFDVNSYGGMAAGCEELSLEIFESRAIKPSVALVDFNCYSAAYYIASAASRVVATPSSGVGSIGALAMRWDVTKALEQAGIKIAVVFAGKYKVDSSPFTEFSEEARARLQISVDACYDRFVAAVVRNRVLTDKAVRDTEAECFDADMALELGLIDAIQLPESAIESAVRDLCNPDDEDDMNMATKPAETTSETTLTPAAPAPGLTAADVTAAVNTALKADRDRRTTILALPEAEKRPKLAAHLANTTEISPDACKSLLAMAAEETAPATPAAPAAPTTGKSPLEIAMDATRQPNVTADGGTGTVTEADTPAAKTARILASQTAATGFQPAKH